MDSYMESGGGREGTDAFLKLQPLSTDMVDSMKHDCMAPLPGGLIILCCSSLHCLTALYETTRSVGATQGAQELDRISVSNWTVCGIV